MLSPAGWTASVGGHVPARRETIRFLKERLDGDQAMLAVEYEDEDGRGHFAVWGLMRHAGGAWKVSGAAGGGRHEPPSTAPWANFGGWRDGRSFRAGGRVHGQEVRSVRMVDATGRAIDDTVDDGIALLMHAGPFDQPWTVVLCGADGTLLRSHPFPGGRSVEPETPG